MRAVGVCSTCHCGRVLFIYFLRNNNNNTTLAQLGKSVETTDEQYADYVASFNKQQARFTC